MHIDTQQSRRTFLRRAGQLGGAGVAAPFLSSLGLIGEAAAAATPTDYRALVCIFMFGGNDYANTLPPFDPASYAAYRASRPSIAIPQAQLAATALASSSNLGGRQYALAPALQKLYPLYAQGKLAPIVNIGTLVEPTTKAQYFAKSVRLPPKLFSHNDQQSHVQSFQPEGADAGWGGRMGDMLQAGNGTAALTCVSMRGTSLWLSGQQVLPYTCGLTGVSELLWGRTSNFGSAQAYNVMRQLMTDDQPNMIAQEHANTSRRAIQLSQSLTTALAGVPPSTFPNFTFDNPLSDQLKMIARLIAIGPSLGLTRQVFFASIGGFDTHSRLLGTHPGLMAGLGAAMSEFYAATAQMGVSDKVTTFTASEFGRTLAENGDGSDHGWGSNHFVLGGAVNGGVIYGTPPIVGMNTNDDIGSGRLIPTTSVDQMAATLALWFGVAPGDLPLVLPNIGNFNPSSWNMGFV